MQTVKHALEDAKEKIKYVQELKRLQDDLLREGEEA